MRMRREQQLADDNQRIGQNNLLVEMVSLLKADKKSDKREESSDINIDRDMFALDARASGAINFSVESFASKYIPAEYGWILMDIINKQMAVDKSLKRGDALSEKKFNAFIYGMPRLLLDGLIQERIRRDFESGMRLEKLFCVYFHITKIFNGFCMRYHNDIQVNCVHKLGQKIGSKKRYTGNLVQDVETSINEACFNRVMIQGFDRTIQRKRPAAKTGGNARKKQKFDFSVYRDKTSDKYIPKGWCVFHFKDKSCKRGDNCSFKHTKWTAAELKKAKEE